VICSLLTYRPAGRKDDKVSNGCPRLQGGAGQHSEDARIHVVKAKKVKKVFFHFFSSASKTMHNIKYRQKARRLKKLQANIDINIKEINTM
jgi:hypothetical protein